MMGGDYSAPTIVFTTTPRKVAYLYMAPSTMLYTYYKYDSSAVADRTYSYRITGWLQGRIRRYGGCGTCQEQLGGRRLGQG